MGTDVWKYDPDKHIPDLSSKVIICTGGNSGTGKATVIELAKHNPKRLYLTARSKAKYDDAMKDVRQAAPRANVEFLELDLASLASVKRAADAVVADNDRLDILINNAGIMGTPPSTTQDGYEIHFGTNHMGHALLTKLLTPLLLRTADKTPNSDVRIVNLTSEGHRLAPGGDLLSPARTSTPGDGTHSFRHYGTSKLCNVLHARELARRYPSLTVTTVHPGRVETPLLQDTMARGGMTAWFMRLSDTLIASPIPVRKGAFTELWAATWPTKKDVVSGSYYVPYGKLSQGSARSRDMKLANSLWEWQEKEFARLGY